jgi:hypothetical protein
LTPTHNYAHAICGRGIQRGKQRTAAAESRRELASETTEKMLGGGRKGTGSAAVLKYDQTGEPLQQEPDDSGEGKTTTGERRDEEVACSVLTPEQIFSQLSMVLQTRCPLPAGEEQRDSSKEVEAERDDADGGCSVPADSSCGVPRKLSSKTKRGRDAKTRKAAAGQQQTKRTKTAAEKRVEKRPPRRRQRHCQPRRRPSAAPLSAGKNPPETVAESESSSTTVPSFASPLTSCGVHVVVISPQTLSPSLLPTTTGGNVAASNPSSPLSPATPFVSKADPPSADENTSVAMETPGNALGQDGPHDKGAAESSNNDYSQIYSNPRPPRSETFAKIVPNSNLLAGRKLCLQMMTVYVSLIHSLLINLQMKEFLLILPWWGKITAAITYDVLHSTTSFWVDSSAKIP